VSLRYKALIAVIVLVALLTCLLVVSSSSLFEEDARIRIAKALDTDRDILDEHIIAAARISSAGMKASAASSELVQLFASDEMIGDNLLPFAREWRRDADGDVAIAAIDSFVAEDRRANVIGTAGEGLAYVAMESDAQVNAKRQAELLADPELTKFVVDFYLPAFNAGTAKDLPADSTAAVLPVAGKVYLVVQSFLWSSIQGKEPVGVGIVLTELSRRWLMRSAGQVAERAESRGGIGKIVFTAGMVTSSTLDGPDAAQSVFDAAREPGEAVRARTGRRDAHRYRVQQPTVPRGQREAYGVHRDQEPRRRAGVLRRGGEACGPDRRRAGPDRGDPGLLRRVHRHPSVAADAGRDAEDPRGRFQHTSQRARS
jgi:hypothetical protein